MVLGYEGSYERVAAFVRAWKTGRQQEQQTSGRGTFVPLVFGPGEAFQFDWSEDWAILGGERTKLQVAHTKLSHSRAFIVRAYPAPAADKRRIALDNYRKAADLGHAAAAFEVARTMYFGEGLPEDEEASRPYFQIAANGGIAHAHYVLAHMYWSGIGADKNADLAEKHVLVAMATGHAEPIRFVGDIVMAERRETTDGRYVEVAKGEWWDTTGIDIVPKEMVDRYCRSAGVICGYFRDISVWDYSFSRSAS